MFETVELECRDCGTRAVVSNQLVGTLPLPTWWRSVGQRCRDCRLRVQRINNLRTREECP